MMCTCVCVYIYIYIYNPMFLTNLTTNVISFNSLQHLTNLKHPSNIYQVSTII